MPSPLTPRSVWSTPTHFLAFGCGAGAMPFAPGTFGTLLFALPVYLLVKDLPLGWYLALVAGLLILGLWLCGATARDLGVHDHPGIVWDELVGFLITLIAAPPGWGWVLLGFLLFRLFDIWKPWPISYLDRNLKGGAGIILDDALAGLFGFLVLQGLAWLQTLYLSS